jgi:hypothetical protein
MGFQFYPFKTSQVSVTGTATQLVAVNSARSGLLLVNFGSTDVYIGPDNTVTTSNGQLLAGTKGTAIGFATTGTVYAITGGGTQTIGILETQ